ncbi:serine-rich adhesin for platelets-like isoform X2 [Littorina saxatilis]
MSCIRRLFSRKNLRSLSSETILVNENRGSDSSTLRPGGSVAAAQNVASTDSNCSDGDVGQSSRPAQRKRLVAEGKVLSSATGTINIKPSPISIEEIKRPECTSTQSVPAKVRALSVDARASSFKPHPRSASCSFSSLRRVARRRRKEDTHRERSPSAGQQESVGTAETQRILSTEVAVDTADRAITSVDLATLVGKDVLDVTETSQNTPEESNVHSSVIAKAAPLEVHVPKDTDAVKDTTKNIRTASKTHEEGKTAGKVVIKIAETYHEKCLAASATAGTLSITPKDTLYPADKGSLTTVCSATRILSLADSSSHTQSSESSNAANADQTVNDPSSEAATTAAQYYHTDAKTSSDELSKPSVSISNAVSEIIRAATRESCSAFNVFESGDIVEYQGTGAADTRTKEETKTPCLECSRERKQALQNLHVDDPSSAASLLSHPEQQRDAKCIVPFTGLTVHQTILAYTCSRSGDVTHPPLSRSPTPPPAPPLPPSLARQAFPQPNSAGASTTSTSQSAAGGSSQPGPSNVIEVCALLHETCLPPVNSITIEKQRSETSQPGSLDSQQNSEINPDTPGASQDASIQQSPEGTAQELRSESFPSSVPAGDTVANETGEPIPPAEDLVTENSRTGADTDSTCTCSNRTTAEGSTHCPLHPRNSPDTAEMDGEAHSAPFDPVASSRAQPQSDTPNNIQPVATSAMERTPTQAQPGTLFDRVLSQDFQAEFRNLAPSAPPAEPAFSSQFNLLAYTQEIETDDAENDPASSQRRRSESANTTAPHVETASSSLFNLLSYTQEIDTDNAQNVPAPLQRPEAESANTSNGFFCQYLESKDPKTNASKPGNAKAGAQSHDSPLACTEENEVQTERDGEVSHLNAMSYQASAFPMSFLASIVNMQDNHHDHQAAQTMESDALQEVKVLQDCTKSLNTKVVEEEAGSDTASVGKADNFVPTGSDKRDTASAGKADNFVPTGSDKRDTASAGKADNSVPTGSDKRDAASAGKADNSVPTGSDKRDTASSGKADNSVPTGSDKRDTASSGKADNSVPTGSDKRDTASSGKADNSVPTGSDERDTASSGKADNSVPTGSDERDTASSGKADNSVPSGSDERDTVSSGKADNSDTAGSDERDTDESKKKRVKLADRRRRIEEVEGEEGEEALTVAGLLDVFELEKLMHTNKAELRSSYKRLRKEKNKATILQQYVVHQCKEQAELSRLIGMLQSQGAALKEERKNKDSELQKICDLMECEDEGNARKHEPLMYKKYCAVKTSAEAKTLLSTIRHRQRALHFLEAMTYRK